MGEQAAILLHYYLLFYFICHGKNYGVQAADIQVLPFYFNFSS
jgi:hypothetical protein